MREERNNTVLEPVGQYSFLKYFNSVYRDQTPYFVESRNSFPYIYSNSQSIFVSSASHLHRQWLHHLDHHPSQTLSPS